MSEPGRRAEPRRDRAGGRGRGRPRHPDLLTPAEWRVVDAVRHGMSNRQIARRRGVSLDAVKFHVTNAVAKLGLADRAALRAWRGVPAHSATRGRRDGGGMDTLRLGPIGQIARPVRDVARAEAWYRDVLGLPHLYTYGDLAFFDCGGTRLMLTAEGGAQAPAILYFRVEDIQAAYDELRSRGVEFEGAPHMIFRHPSGTEEWMAFFTDPDGHHLAVMAQVPAAG
jgi:DNA-binding CsgD family transcriptional regulator/catechol 2,3-dioxygenase-like lactoylglutathione lyase family enzyme